MAPVRSEIALLPRPLDGHRDAGAVQVHEQRAATGVETGAREFGAAVVARRHLLAGSGDVGRGRKLRPEGSEGRGTGHNTRDAVSQLSPLALALVT